MLRANLPNRYHADGGQASTGWSVRYRITSAAKSLAVSYRRWRSFSSAFITIQSSSPRTARAQLRGSALRCAETVVSVVAERAQPRARLGRLVLADDPAHLVEAALRNVSWSNGVVPVKQLVEQHAQAVDVAAGVDVHARQLGLLRAHVQRRADELVRSR